MSEVPKNLIIIIIILSLTIFNTVCKKFSILNDLPDVEYEVIPEVFSFIASIRYGEFPFSCGSLVSDEYVMVLANLVDNNSKYNVKIQGLSCRIGDYLTNVEGSGIKVEHIFFPPFYNFSATYGNIALLKLEHPAIKMFPIDVPEKKLEYGEICKIIGWTNNVPIKKLVVLNVYLADIHECLEKMKEVPFSILSNVPKQTNFDPNIHICLKSVKKKMPNLEAIGSMLVCNGVQHGIIVFQLSTPIYGTHENFYWLSIRLDNFSDWIQDVISPISEEFVAVINN